MSFSFSEVREETSSLCMDHKGCVESISHSGLETTFGDNDPSPLHIEAQSLEMEQVRVKEENGSVSGPSSGSSFDSVVKEDFGPDSLSLVQSKMLEEWKPDPLDLQISDSLLPGTSHSLCKYQIIAESFQMATDYIIHKMPLDSIRLITD